MTKKAHILRQIFRARCRREIARRIHGRNLFPSRDPRSQEAGPTLNRAPKARAIDDRAPITSPSSDQKPTALQTFDRAPSLKPSSNPALIAYRSRDQAPNPLLILDQASNYRSTYNRAPNTPPSSNRSSRQQYLLPAPRRRTERLENSG